MLLRPSIWVNLGGFPEAHYSITGSVILTNEVTTCISQVVLRVQRTLSHRAGHAPLPRAVLAAQGDSSSPGSRGAGRGCACRRSRAHTWCQAWRPGSGSNAPPPPAPKGQMRTNERRVVSVSLLPPLRRASLAPSLTQPGEMLRDQESTCHRAGPSFRDSGVLGARGGGC